MPICAKRFLPALLRQLTLLNRHYGWTPTAVSALSYLLSLLRHLFCTNKMQWVRDKCREAGLPGMEMNDVHLVSCKHGVGIGPLMRKVTNGYCVCYAKGNKRLLHRLWENKQTAVSPLILRERNGCCAVYAKVNKRLLRRLCEKKRPAFAPLINGTFSPLRSHNFDQK